MAQKKWSFFNFRCGRRSSHGKRPEMDFDRSTRRKRHWNYYLIHGKQVPELNHAIPCFPHHSGFWVINYQQ